MRTGWYSRRPESLSTSFGPAYITASSASAAVARRSTAHFCRAFRRTFGQTPHAYVTTRRLERAKSLMLESHEQLSVIALLCGFTDQAHLSKLFRQHTGEPPGAWRRRRASEGHDPARRSFSELETVRPISRQNSISIQDASDRAAEKSHRLQMRTDQ